MNATDTSGLLFLQAALQAAFPSCTDLSDDPARGITGFTPHLSLGQWTSKQQLLAAMQEYSSDSELLGLQFEVNEVCICSRQSYRDPFSVRYTVPLGTATPSARYHQPQLVDTPYIATTTPNLHQLLGLTDSPTDKRRFGLGGGASGLWNFAYGANMSPSKLGGSRGLHPQESRPGVLRGYRLAFNHRGGFGNIVQGPTPAAEAPTAAAAAGGGEVQISSAAAPVDVHGVLHRLTPAELSDLMCMEHEYQPVVVMVQPYNRQQQVIEHHQAGQQPSSQQQQQQQVPDSKVSQPQLAENSQEQQQEPDLVPAIAFMSPPDRCISEGLPPIRRYLDLLREGAQHWELDQHYTTWLQQHPALGGSADRGPAYYTSPGGQPLSAWPKIRTGGSQQQSNRQRGGRGGRGRGSKRDRGRAEDSTRAAKAELPAA